LCISCGVCLGSCTTAALTLPEVSMVTLLTEIRKRKASRLVLLCEKAILPDLHPEAEKRLSPIWIPCLGAVHPALVEQASRAGVTEIMAAGCREGDCHYRTGARWFADRLARSREPLPRKSADLSRVIFGEVSSGGGEADLMKMERFLHGEGALPGSVQKVSPGWVGKVTEQLIWALPLLLVFIFSARSVYSFYGKNESLLVLSMKYTAAPEKCRTRTPEELAKLPAHMRTAVDCDRRRRDVRIRLDIDGKTRLDRLYKGGGVWHDGPIFVYEKFPLPPGKHAFDWTLAEEPSGTTFKRKNDADLRPGRMTLLELDSKQSP
ncbi:MAG TPA: hydrogenase iron-sulfur subunit, partial [Nitrospiria bacterium]|nr:hydrogenase iron-sulfur subunit [Nitrospiria bacterium]